MKVKVGVSARHIHLTEDSYNILFKDKEIVKVRDLTQGGEFATNKVVSVIGSKSRIDNIRVVLPFRDKDQVEVSVTDSYKLGLDIPVNVSGEVINAPQVTLEGDNGSVKSPIIIANRHLHLNTIDSNNLKLYNGDKVSVKIDGIRKGILFNVVVRVKDTYNMEVHLDTDEANALGIKTGDIVEVMEEYNG